MLLQLSHFPTWNVSVKIPALFGRLNKMFFYTVLDIAAAVNPDFLIAVSKSRGSLVGRTLLSA